MKIRFLMLPLVIGLLMAQAPTKIGINQLKGTANPTGQVFVVLSSGQVVFAELGAGLVLDTSGTKPTIRVSVLSPVLPTRIIGEALTEVAGAVSLKNSPAAGTVAIWRNGIRQKEGLDYTLNGRTISTATAYPPGCCDGDVLLADYEVALALVANR